MVLTNQIMKEENKLDLLYCQGYFSLFIIFNRKYKEEGEKIERKPKEKLSFNYGLLDLMNHSLNPSLSMIML